MTIRHDSQSRSIIIGSVSLDLGEAMRHSTDLHRAIGRLKSQIKTEALKAAKTRKTTDPDGSLEQGSRPAAAAGKGKLLNFTARGDQ